MGSLRSALLFAPGAFAFSLGVWQVQRLQQKQTEVAYRKKLLDGEPLHLSSSHNQTEEGARDGALKRHTPVTCRGTFQHERSLYVGPRVRSELGQAFQGYELVTPLVLEEGEDNGGFDKKKGNNDHFGSRWTSFFSRQKGSDKDGDTKQAEALGERERESSGGSASSSGVLQSNQKVVLVLRGWVPQLWRDQPEKFESLMPKDTVQVEGLVKPSDSPGYFAPPNSPEQGQWFYYDLKAMVSARNDRSFTRIQFILLSLFSLLSPHRNFSLPLFCVLVLGQSLRIDIGNRNNFGAKWRSQSWYGFIFAGDVGRD